MVRIGLDWRWSSWISALRLVEWIGSHVNPIQSNPTSSLVRHRAKEKKLWFCSECCYPVVFVEWDKKTKGRRCGNCSSAKDEFMLIVSIVTGAPAAVRCVAFVALLT
jgi:DNA-directed RNA polymerase subunit RPC12/RpoP